MKMYKCSSSNLRHAIWFTSTVAAFKTPAIHTLYERKRAESEDRMTVISHICRKMVFSIFDFLCDNTPYIPAVIPD